MLNRRSFLKSALMSPLLGVFGLRKAVAGPVKEFRDPADKSTHGMGWKISEPKIDFPIDNVGEKFEEPQSWQTSESVRVMDFDEQIISVDEIQGRLFVFCEHSVWEFDIDHEGFPRRQLEQYL